MYAVRSREEIDSTGHVNVNVIGRHQVTSFLNVQLQHVADSTCRSSSDTDQERKLEEFFTVFKPSSFDGSCSGKETSEHLHKMNTKCL